MCVRCSQPKLELLPSVCMGARGTMSMGRSRAGEVGESSSHTEHGQSVYLALCSVGTPSSRLFHGPPYLSHALLLPPLPPPVRMLSLGSLQAHTHTYTHTSLPAHGWVHPRATVQENVDTSTELRDKTVAVRDGGSCQGDIYQQTLTEPTVIFQTLQTHWSTHRNRKIAMSNSLKIGFK